MIAWPARVSSYTEMTERSEEFLVSVTRSLVSEGIIGLQAWGSRTCIRACPRVMPMDSAASPWPRSTEPTAPRTTSAM